MDALMLIDLQIGLCKAGGNGTSPLSEAVTRLGTLNAAATCLEAARAARLPVIHVRLGFEPGHINRTNRTSRFDDHQRAGRFTLGTADTEFCPEVMPEAGETIVTKGSVSPFASTALLSWLRSAGVRSLAIAGVATHLAVESAAREAADRGFLPLVVSDACAAPGPLHDHSLGSTLPAFADVVTAEAYAAQVQSS